MQFVDDGLTSRLNTKEIEDFDDVVGVGAGSVDGFNFAHTGEVGTNGREVVLARLIVKLYVGSLDVRNSLESHVANLLFELKQHCVRWWVLRQLSKIFFGVNTRDECQGSGVLFLVRLDKKACCTLEFILNFQTSHVLLLEVALVELENQTALCDVSFEGCDVDRCGHFDGRRKFLSLFGVVLLLTRQANCHCWCVWNLSGVDNLDDTRQTLGYVDRCNTRIVERTHGHLCTWFTNGLCGDDTGCFVRIDACLVKSNNGFFNHLLCLRLGQLLLSTSVDGHGKVVINSVGKSSRSVGFDSCLEGLEDWVFCQLVHIGCEFFFSVIGIHVCSGFCTRQSASASL